MKSIASALRYLFVITNCHLSWAGRSNETTSYVFQVKHSVISLAEQLPTHTQLFDTWPTERVRTNLPDLISALVVSANNDDNDSKEVPLVGQPIHVVVGDRLTVELQNDVNNLAGISLHFHGFSYSDAFEYAGAVGVSQCPLAEGERFVYDIVVNETAGTYWYHSSASNLASYAGIAKASSLVPPSSQYDAIRGPLIVHPKESEEVVDKLHANSSLGDKFSYNNERILFFQDGFISSSAERYLQHVGNLVPPASKSDEGFVVATSQWDFGTCNGKLREIITVKPNQTYTFRLINGGQHHALKFSISDGDFPLTVVAIDSYLVKPYTVNSVVLHVGERFDVEVQVPNFVTSESFWLKADTLESHTQGYQNGVRAILIVSNEETVPGDDDVLDPTNIAQMMKNDVKVLNCYHADYCIPITELIPLSPESDNISLAENGLAFASSKTGQSEASSSEFHFVETHFQPAPQYGHFIRVDSSYWIQNDFPPVAMLSREYRPPDSSIHPHSVPLEVGSNSSVTIVWRTTMLMDVPMYIHGHSVEILDIVHPKRDDCNIAYCELTQDYSTKTLDKIKVLDKTWQGIKKDTFVIPAGGAIVTRMKTRDKGLWLGYGNIDVHQQDGISFVLNVGYQVPKTDNWLPTDFPSCNTTLIKTLQMNPACECFHDKDRPLAFDMSSEKYLCSRTHLCHHTRSQASNLDSYQYKQGLSSIQNDIRVWKMSPGSVFIVSFALIVMLTAITLVVFLPPIQSKQNEKGNGGESSSSTLSRLYHNSMKRLSLLSWTADLTTETTTTATMNRSEFPRRRSTIDVSVCDSSYIGTVRDVSVIENEGVDGSHHVQNEDDECEHDLDSCNDSYRKRRLSSFAASIEGRLDRAIGSLLVERSYEDEGVDRLSSQVLEFIPDGYAVRGSLTFEACDLGIAGASSPLSTQTRYIFLQQFRSYFHTCCNLLRLIEVCGIAFLMGLLYRQDFREATEATISEVISLVDLIVVTWTFARMYSIIPLQHQWFKSIQIVHKSRRFSLSPVLFARVLVLLIGESLWPVASCIICFSVMGLTNWITIFKISLLIGMNNICHLSLGAACAMVGSIHYGMILATMMSQISILISGAFTKLPPSIELLRWLSPFFWTMRGLIKSIFRWSDNYSCVPGSSDIEGGVTQCFIEESMIIDQLKRRGMYDPSSTSLVEECIGLMLILLSIHIFISFRCIFSFYRIDWLRLKRLKSNVNCFRHSLH